MADAPDARRERRSIVALLSSVFTSSAAALAQETVLGKLVYDLTHRVFDLGMLGLVEFAPAALLVLATGTVADRFDRRRVVTAGVLGQAAVSTGLAVYAARHGRSVLPIYALALLFGATRAFAAPAARSLPADLVSAEKLPRLVARYSGTWQAALVVGPVLGGFLYAGAVWLPFVAVAALLVISGVAVLAVELPPRQAAAPRRRLDAVELAAAERAGSEVGAPERWTGELVAEAAMPVRPAEPPAGGRASWREAVEGLRFVKDRPVLLGAISLDLFAVLFGGAVALLPAIATDRLGVGAVGLGWLRAAGGLGAASVTLMLAVRPLTRRVGHTLLAVVAAFGVFTIVLGTTRSYAVAFIAMAALSGADAVSVFVRATLVPLATPEDKRGRVLAVENVFIGASNELGAFESGVAGQLLGTSAAVVLGGAATLAVAGGWWFLFAPLRRLDRFPDPDADANADAKADGL